jgi:uncharacterized protein with PIN domain
MSASLWWWWGQIKAPVKWILGLLQTQSRLKALETEIATIKDERTRHSGHRKCPECGERDLRLVDRYRFKRHPFDRQRYFHEKWRCYSCGKMDDVNHPEPGG